VRRLVEQGSVQLNGDKISDPKATPDFQQGAVLRLDKTRAVRLAGV
jgi:tyrosyl-tRNA synthetase